MDPGKLGQAGEHWDRQENTGMGRRTLGQAGEALHLR